MEKTKIKKGGLMYGKERGESLRSILKSIVVVEMRLTLAHKKLELNLAKGLRMILVAIVDISNQLDLVHLN